MDYLHYTAGLGFSWNNKPRRKYSAAEKLLIEKSGRESNQIEDWKTRNNSCCSHMKWWKHGKKMFSNSDLTATLIGVNKDTRFSIYLQAIICGRKLSVDKFEE